MMAIPSVFILDLHRSLIFWGGLRGMDRLLWMAYLRSLALATEVTQEIFAMFKYACISWLVNSILKMHCSERAMLECWRSTKCFFKLVFRSESLTKPWFWLEFSELFGKFSGFREYKSRSRWRSRLIPRYYPRNRSSQVTSWKSAI